MEEKRLLESWKEIAAYLKRSVRTCRRWEDELGLPIHRLDGTPSARVFAYPDELDQWMDAKLNHVEAAAKEDVFTRSKKKKYLLASSAMIIALALIAILARQLFIKTAVPLPPHNPFVAVLPFENVTGDGSLDPWTTAFQDLLITDLKQSRLVNAISMHWISLALRELNLGDAQKFSSEDLKRISEKLHVEYAITGSLGKSGGDTKINILVQNPKNGETIKSLQTACQDERDFFDRVDALSKEIKSALGLTPKLVSQDTDNKVRLISTSSPEAFRLYSQAHLLVGLQRYQERIPSLQKAVEIDPKFGLAYAWLCVADKCAERWDDYVMNFQKAIELSDRISERDRLLLQAEYCGNYKFVEKKLAGREDTRAIWRSLGPSDLQTELKINETLWSLYPDFPEDENGDLPLLDLYMELEDWDKAVQILERLNLGGNKEQSTIQTIVECYRAMGLYDRAEKILGDYERANPDMGTWANERRGLALDQGKYNDALRYLNAEQSQDKKRTYGYYSQLGYIYWAMDDLASAEKTYRTVVDPNNPGEEMQRTYDLEVLCLSQGKVSKAIDLAKQLAAWAKDLAMGNSIYLDVERARHYELAYLYRLSGNLEEALKEAEIACSGYKELGIGATRALYLRAMINLEMNRMEDFDKQAEEIKKFIDKESRPKYMKIYYHLLGHKEMKNKNFDKAIAYFEKAQEQVVPGGSCFGATDREPAKYFYSLAEAYELSGGLTRANMDRLRVYEKVWRPTAKGSFSGDLYARSFYRYAKVNDSYFQGPGIAWEQYRTAAIENYRKFLSLWGNADPIFPEVEDAMQRLAALESK